MDGKLGEDITLDSLVAVAGSSRFHFARAFEAEMGMTPMRSVMSRRLERRRHLVAETDLPLAEIAFVCGFSNQSHMTTALRRVTGTTPGDSRRGCNSRDLNARGGLG